MLLVEHDLVEKFVNETRSLVQNKSHWCLDQTSRKQIFWCYDRRAFNWDIFVLLVSLERTKRAERAELASPIAYPPIQSHRDDGIGVSVLYLY
jgi:hypothetical protein